MLLGDTQVVQERVASKDGTAFTISGKTYSVSDADGNEVFTGTLTVTNPGEPVQIVSFPFTPATEGNFYARLSVVVNGVTTSFDRSLWVIKTPPGKRAQQAAACWLICSELGKADDKRFYETVNQYWAIWAMKGPALQALYAKRQAIEYLMGQAIEDVDFEEAGVSESRDQYTKHLQGLYALLTTQINVIQANLAGSRGAAVGQMTATAPIEAIGGRPDPNDRRFRGDALLPGWAWTRWV